MIFLLGLGLACIANAQDYSFPKNDEGEYEFSEVVEVNLSKSLLFANATKWAMDYYKERGYKNVVQLESELNGRLIIKDYGARIDTYSKKHGPLRLVKVYYILSIDCKDNKYRYIINNIKIKSPFNSSDFGGVFGAGLEWDMTHKQHLEKTDEYKHQIDSINSLMLNAKGRKLKKLQDQVEDLNEKVTSELEMYKEEYLIFDHLIKSLKKKMSDNSDF